MTPAYLFTRAEWARLSDADKRLVARYRRRIVERAAAEHERRYGHHLFELADALHHHVR